MEEELYDAVVNGDLAQLRAALAAGVEVDARDEDGWTALHWAASEGHTACLQALLAAGASVHALDHYYWDWTPLHSAMTAREGHAACVRALIAAGSDVNRRDGEGYTPFRRAIITNRRCVLKILLRAGAYLEMREGDRRNHNASTYALVKEIIAAGGWDEYVLRRVCTLFRLVAKATHNKLPHAIDAEIAAFIQPPGGY